MLQPANSIAKIMIPHWFNVGIGAGAATMISN